MIYLKVQSLKAPKTGIFENEISYRVGRCSQKNAKKVLFYSIDAIQLMNKV
jgi:hypothetical protein